jgi:hypothetical protein
MGNDLTVPEKILSCALELDREKGIFTAEDLVVRCWERFPDTFGLQGYAGKYPDSNRILTNIMGTKGLRGKGWLRKVGEKRYRVTEVAQQAIQVGRRADQGGPLCRAASLRRDTVEILERLVASRAFDKYRLKQELTFGDLCSFWNISPRSNAQQLNLAVKEAEAAIGAAEDLLASKTSAALLLPGTTIHITKTDLSTARSLQKHLLEAFSLDLDVIRSRWDERLPR